MGHSAGDKLLALQAGVDLVEDRLRLPRVLTRADDEEIGVRAHRPHVEDDHVARQLLLGESGDAAGLFEGAQGGVCVLSGAA